MVFQTFFRAIFVPPWQKQSASQTTQQLLARKNVQKTTFEATQSVEPTTVIEVHFTVRFLICNDRYVEICTRQKITISQGSKSKDQKIRPYLSHSMSKEMIN